MDSPTLSAIEPWLTKLRPEYVLGVGMVKTTILLKAFAIELSKHWIPLMSCAAFTLLSLVLAELPPDQSNTWLVRGTGILAVIFLLVSSYKTWAEEHLLRRKVEAELNSEADIHGTITVSASPRPMLINTAITQPAFPATTLLFSFDCANHGRKTCQISRLYVSARLNAKHMFTEIIPLHEGVKTVQHGERFYCRVQFPFTQIDMDKLPEVEMEVYLMDSLETVYRNTTTITNFKFLPATT